MTLTSSSDKSKVVESLDGYVARQVIAPGESAFLRHDKNILSRDMNILQRRRLHFTMIVIHIDAAIQAICFTFTTYEVLQHATSFSVAGVS